MTLSRIELAELVALRAEVSRLKHTAERMVWERKADLDAAEKCNAVSRATIKQRNEVATDLAEAHALLRAMTEELSRASTDFAVNKDAWRQHYEAEAKRLAERTAIEQANWFADHLNHERDDAVAEEREACAKVALGSFPLPIVVGQTKKDYGAGLATAIAAAIRARGSR
jgi:hypothetical protein